MCAPPRPPPQSVIASYGPVRRDCAANQSMETRTIKIRPPHEILVIIASASSKGWSDETAQQIKLGVAMTNGKSCD